MGGSVDQRVIELVKQHVEGVDVVEGTRTELVYHQHAYEYWWEEWEEVPFTDRDYTKREKAFAELMKVGKTAVPTLVDIITSEKGKYPDQYSYSGGGTAEALELLADAEISRALVQPFQKKVEQCSEGFTEPYKDQIWTIAKIWNKCPVPEAIPALYAALTTKTDPLHPSYLFNIYHRHQFIDALARIGTREAITAILSAAKQDANAKYGPESHYEYAIRRLQETMPDNGKKLYEIYLTTKDQEKRQIASEALSWRKPIYWAMKKLGV